ITVNVGSCAFNRTVGFTWYDRVLFGVTFVILAFVELTLAHTKLDALQFVLAVLIGGLALRAYTLKRQGLTTVMLHRQVAEMVTLGSEREISVVPLYAVSQDAAATIVDLSATMGVDFLHIGATQRTALAKLLRGSVVTSVAQQLPDSIQLVIFG